MLAAITATAGTNTYNLNAGDTLTVNGDYDENLRVNFRGGGRVVVNNGADLGTVRLVAAGNVAPGTARATFNGGSSADFLEYVGRGGDDSLTIRRNAAVGVLLFDVSDDRGRTGKAQLSLQGGSQVGDVTYVGSRGADSLFVSGTVFGGDIDAQLFGGADRVVFGPNAEVLSPDQPASPGNEPGFGQITIEGGTGGDLFDFRGGTYENLTIDGGDGNDRLRFRDAAVDAPTTFLGFVDVDLGNGADRVDTPGATNFVFGGTIATGAGNDTLTLSGITGGNTGRGGDLTIDTGTAGGRDVVRMGGMGYLGQVTVNWGGNFVFDETAFNNFRSVFAGPSIVLSGGAAGTTANLAFDEFSNARGGFAVNSQSELRMFSNLSTERASSSAAGSIVTAGGRDFVRINSASLVSLSIQTGGGSDRIEVINGTTVSDGPQIDTGNGGDIVLLRNSRVLNLRSQRMNLEFGGGRRSNRLVMGGNDIRRMNVEYAGRTIISEPSGNLIGELGVTESAGTVGTASLIWSSDDGTGIGVLTLDAINAVRVTYRGTVGTVTANLGAGSDLLTFTGVLFNGGESSLINAGGGNDFVSLESSDVTPGITVNLGNGDDELDNLFAFLGDNSVLNGGGGRDFLADPNTGGSVRNFEEFGLTI